MKYLTDDQIGMLMGLAARRRCPCCDQMHGEWYGPADPRYEKLLMALDDAGCNQPRRGFRRVTPERVLRALEAAGLVRP